MSDSSFKQVCTTGQLRNGSAIRFDINTEAFESGFVIRFDDQLHAYRNRCPHQGTELDWMPGQVFDADGDALICSTHGARFHPQSGLCIEGPCLGQKLSALPVRIDGTAVLVKY